MHDPYQSSLTTSEEKMGIMRVFILPAIVWSTLIALIYLIF